MASETAEQSKQLVYVFWPEEPEGIVFVGGNKTVFRNGRLILDESNPAQKSAVQHFEAAAGKGADYIIVRNLKQEGLEALLHRRNSRAMSRRADATHPATILNDAEFMSASMLTRPIDPRRPLSVAEQVEAMAVGGTKSASDPVVVLPFANETDADREAIAEAAKRADADSDKSLPPDGESWSLEDEQTGSPAPDDGADGPFG